MRSRKTRGIASVKHFNLLKQALLFFTVGQMLNLAYGAYDIITPPGKGIVKDLILEEEVFFGAAHLSQKKLEESLLFSHTGRIQR
jgi:hypothetical protein